MTDKLDQIAAHVREATDSHPHYDGFTKPGYFCYPAKDFEKATGLTGIAKDYVMPEGKDPVEVFLPLFHVEVQGRMIGEQLDVMKKAGGGTPEQAKAYHAEAQQQFSQFHAEMQHLQIEGSLQQVEQKAVEGYGLQEKLRQAKGFADLTKAVGTVTADELVAVGKATRVEMKNGLNACYAELERLNPELSVLTPEIERLEQGRDVVHGVLSKFNIPDIKRYSIDRINGIEARKDPAWVKRQAQTEKAAGAYTPWIPSPSTQRLIIQKAQQRDRGQGQEQAQGFSR